MSARRRAAIAAEPAGESRGFMAPMELAPMPLET